MIKMAPEVKPRTVRKPRSVTANAPRKGGDGPKVQVKASEPPPAGGAKYLPTTLSLDRPLIDRLDDWAHEKRLTRSAAARFVMSMGLSK
jgi:hypothetical protein